MRLKEREIERHKILCEWKKQYVEPMRERKRERCSEHMWVKIDRNKETHNLSKIVARINTWFIYYPYVTFFFLLIIWYLGEGTLNYMHLYWKNYEMSIKSQNAWFCSLLIKLLLWIFSQHILFMYVLVPAYIHWMCFQ